ncbi:MAG: cysteine desulfurase NifS [Firmicutes bacterium]|nr:cysteine desulfurase NifS [Bacillota bacterium]
MERKITYLDHAATTYVDPIVVKAMDPYFTDKFYNPSSLYTPARELASMVSDARKTVAKWINARNDTEIIFTGSGSEGDNTAIFGIAFANRHKGRHIITSPIEHPAVLETVEGMERFGFEHTIVPVDKSGILDLDELRKAIRPDTVLITVMFANNEIGSIQPVAEIGRIAREKGIFFHTDAVQAAGSLPIDVQEMNIDSLTIAAHKFYGPKGVGALYIRDGVPFERFMLGGHQERGRRAGTHNNAGIAGLAAALDLACSKMEENNKKIIYLREKLVKGIMENIPDVIYNGHPEKRLPNNTNFCFKFIESEAILLHLDMLGICASSGSACSSGSEDPSHVLAAIGLTPDIARGSIRMTLGRENTEEEIDFVIERMKKVIENLRMMSPLVN